MTTTDPGRSADADTDQQTRPPNTGAGQSQGKKRGVLATAWRTVSAGIGALMGLVPHILHHVGLIAGAALVGGAAGNLLFGVLGLLFSFPLLRRLHRRFHTWKAPAIALALLALMFALSALVIGPAISGSAAENPPPAPLQTPTPGHTEHHGG